MTTIAAAMEDAMRRHLADLMAIQQLSMPLTLHSDFQSNKGSVLAVVNFPNTTGRDCNGVANFGKVYQKRLDYDSLIATGSAKIKDMFQPKKQERFRRLLRMDILPDGIEYVLDFTPPLEGEECSELTASLWLPASTKTWWMSGHYKPSGLLTSGPRFHEGLCVRPLSDKPVGAVLVLGHDDECSCSTTYSSISDIWASADDVPGIYHGDWVPAYREKVKDYCRVRHCMNLVRILRALAGEDLLVNSATRMWTLAHLAVYLDVVPVVRDSITQWFSAAPNTKFIEIYPEESFKIALMLQMRDVLLASFKILVSERAVDHAAAVSLPKPPSVTWMERPRTDYGDLPEDPVEHASRAFADRLKAKFNSLRGDMVYDETLKSDEWGKLQFYTGLIANTAAATYPPSPFLASLLKDLRKLQGALLSQIHTHVRNCIEAGPTGRLLDLIAAQRAHYCPPQRQTAIPALVALRDDQQRTCMPFFWYNLRDMYPGLHSSGYHVYRFEYVINIANTFNEHLQEALDKKYLEVSFDDFRDRLHSNYAFDRKLFHEQVELQASVLSMQVIGARDLETDGIQFLMSDHLVLTLEEGETKYLPLWAGGFDDGTGGVFQDEVPPTDMGPSEPGPHYHTGHTVVASSTGGAGGGTDASSTVDYAGTTSTYSDLGVGRLDLEDYTTTRSMAAQDSVSTTVDDDRSRVVSLASEAFTNADESSMREAMFAVPADHQELGRAVEHYVDGVSDDWEVETETEDGDDGEDDDAEQRGDDDDAMDTDSTISLGGGSDDDDLSDFTMV